MRLSCGRHSDQYDDVYAAPHVGVQPQLATQSGLSAEDRLVLSTTEKQPQHICLEALTWTMAREEVRKCPGLSLGFWNEILCLRHGDDLRARVVGDEFKKPCTLIW